MRNLYPCLCEIDRRGQNPHSQPSISEKVLRFADGVHEASTEQPLALAAARLAWEGMVDLVLSGNGANTKILKQNEL